MYNFFSLWIKDRFFIIYLLYQNRIWNGKKIEFSSVLIFLLLIRLECFGIILVIGEILNYPYLEEEYNMIIKIRVINFWIVILVLIIYFMVRVVETRFKFRLILLFIRMYFIIKFNDFIIFFIVYEIVFIFIIFTILILGYRFERLIASYLIIFYSFIFSRPRLILVILIDKTFLIKSWLNYSFLLLYFLVGSFMVKFPIFGFHYWLPVAHVEASTVGSIILAGVLLKLGGLGIWYVVRYMGFIVKFHWMSFAVPILMLIILRIRDLKIMIAYSSVAHMRIVFYVIIVGRNMRKYGIVIIIFYHGFISPLIFWVVGILGWWKTRSLLVVKIISFSYLYLIVLFFLFIINIGFPPFIGFLREIFILKSLVIWQYALGLIILGVLLRCYYNIYLFWCFNNMMGIVFKINFIRFELFIFIICGILLNFY